MSKDELLIEQRHIFDTEGAEWFMNIAVKPASDQGVIYKCYLLSTSGWGVEVAGRDRKYVEVAAWESAHRREAPHA
jgi:hypothetical protein